MTPEPIISMSRRSMARHVENRGVSPPAAPGAIKAVGGGRVGLLTGGSDKHYSQGLAAALANEGIAVDFIGSDELDCEDVRNLPALTFFNLRGDQRQGAGPFRKVWRIMAYYSRLVGYAARCEPTVLHILWNNKFVIFDRTLLMFYYRALGKRIVLTAHNVNAGKRDALDSWINRTSLRVQYRLCHHVFVHTEQMKRELVEEFGVSTNRVTVIPYGINNAVPMSDVTKRTARIRLGLASDQRVLLFFGQIAPYKGLEHLVSALASMGAPRERLSVLIAGRVDPASTQYWQQIEEAIAQSGVSNSVKLQLGFIPDEDIELYFKAADAVVLPYNHVYQSGVAFLAYSFGLPLIAADVGSLREDVIEGVTGFICRPRDPAALADAIDRYFTSDLYEDLVNRQPAIRDFALQRHSWSVVGAMTSVVYATLEGQAAPSSGGHQ